MAGINTPQNKVCFNIPQSKTDSEKLQARNNIGAAALASLAASFESRAPSYNWSANEVCTYGGALWQFDANHSGAWTGADAHEVTILDVFSPILTDWKDVTDEFSLKYAGETIGYGGIYCNKLLKELFIDVRIDLTTPLTINAYGKMNHYDVFNVPPNYVINPQMSSLTPLYLDERTPGPGFTFTWYGNDSINVQFVSNKNASASIFSYGICGRINYQ